MRSSSPRRFAPCPASSARPRPPAGARPDVAGRGVPGRRRLGARHPGDHRPRQPALEGTDGTLTGVAAVDRDFLHALFGSFPYVFGLVLLLTLMLLTRAFRSVVLAVKAVVLNLLSLGAAFGIVVIVFQQGHGSSLWDIEATQSVTAWIPLMIFAFLYGLSMDYEVFMLGRMREAYDETGSTEQAIELGLARTGKLVTSAALILMFAFLVLSTSPGYEVKPLAIGWRPGSSSTPRSSARCSCRR